MGLVNPTTKVQGLNYLKMISKAWTSEYQLLICTSDQQQP